jgi:hypothetical protein
LTLKPGFWSSVGYQQMTHKKPPGIHQYRRFSSAEEEKEQPSGKSCPRY